MFSILADHCKAAVAFVQSLIQEYPPATERRGAGSFRPGASAGREPTRRVHAGGEHVSDFAGAAPPALLQAYREGAHADEPVDNSRRRSFVI